MTSKATTHRPRRATALVLCAAVGAACLGLSTTALADSAKGARGAEFARDGDAAERSERRGWHRSKYDRDGEKLGPEERRERMRVRAAQRFYRMDRDSDGEISWAEFLASAEERHERRAKRREARAERREARAEERGARGERRHARRSWRGGRDLSPEERRHRMRARAERRFARMDRDGDGAITWGEYWSAVEKRAERRAERGKKRGERRGFRHRHKRGGHRAR